MLDSVLLPVDCGWVTKRTLLPSRILDSLGFRPAANEEAATTSWPYHAFLSLRYAGVLCLVWISLAGCTKKAPSASQVEILVRASIAPHFALQNFQVEYSSTNENSGSVRFRGRLKATERLYNFNRSVASEIQQSIPDETPSDQEVGEWLSRVGIEEDLSTPRKLAAQKLEFIKLVKLASQGSLQQVLESGVESPISGTVDATFEFGEWKLSKPTFDSRFPPGFPRSLGQGLPIDGTPEIDDLAGRIAKAASAYKATIDELRSRAEKADEDAEEAKEAVAEAERQKIADAESLLRKTSLQAFTVGRKYDGKMVWGKKEYHVYMQVKEQDEVAGTFKLWVSDAESMSPKREFSGTLPTGERRQLDSHALPILLVGLGSGTSDSKTPPFLRDNMSKFYLEASKDRNVRGYFYSFFWGGWGEEVEISLSSR